MMRYFLIVFSFVFIATASSLVAQQSKKPADASGDKLKVADTKPEKFDMFFKIKEDKFDTNTVKSVVNGVMMRLNSAGSSATKDYGVYLGHDTIQVRFLTNKRDVTDWYNLLSHQGILRVHLASDTTYFATVDSNKIPKGHIIVSELDGKTKHYVYDRILNGNLMQLTNSYEQFDSPSLTGLVLPKDTAYKSFLFTKGMRFAIVIDGIVYTSGAPTGDSLAINQFPLLTQYPAAYTFAMDRAVRYPYPVPVEFLGWRKSEDK